MIRLPDIDLADDLWPGSGAEAESTTDGEGVRLAGSVPAPRRVLFDPRTPEVRRIQRERAKAWALEVFGPSLGAAACGLLEDGGDE